jgi:hypothetical protein
MRQMPGVDDGTVVDFVADAIVGSITCGDGMSCGCENRFDIASLFSVA